MADREAHAEIETLKAELARLREDFAGVAAALRDAGMAETENMRENTSEFLSNLKEHLGHALDEAKEKGKRSMEVVENQVSEHPFASLLIAFGVGFVLGKLLDRK